MLKWGKPLSAFNDYFSLMNSLINTEKSINLSIYQNPIIKTTTIKCT